MIQSLPVSTLHAILILDAETGCLTWRERGVEWFSGARFPTRACASWNAKYAGTEALASPHPEGYRQGKFLGCQTTRHVVIFAMTNGRWPEGEVDHRDNDRGNDRPDNLREATHAQNAWNAPGRAGTSRFRGVSWDSKNRKWIAQAGWRWLGRHTSEVAAARAYDAFVRAEHGEFARLNFPEAA